MEIITRLDAAKSGLKRYYTGKKCKHGHDSERYVYNGHCVIRALSSIISSVCISPRLPRIHKPSGRAGPVTIKTLARATLFRMTIASSTPTPGAR